VCGAFRQGQKDFRGLDKHQWFDLLTGFICKMHNAGILHRDLSVGNLMLTQAKDGQITPYLIDIGRAKVVKGPLGGRHRILDLMRICYKLDWPDREFFIQCYSKCWGKTFSPFWRLAVRYYDFKQGSKKFLKGKLKKNS
jgi:serine/threonine protein kinase